MNYREQLWSDPRNWERLSGTTLANTNPDGVFTIEKLRATMQQFQPQKPMKVMVGVPNVDGCVHMEADDCDWWLVSRVAFAHLEREGKRDRPISQNDILGVRPGTFGGAEVYYYSGDYGELPGPLGAHVMWILAGLLAALFVALAAWLSG